MKLLKIKTPNSFLSGGGIQATGNYPRKQRLNLHAIYGDFQGEFK